MTDLAKRLAAITRHLAVRTEIYRVIVDAKGNIVKRIYRGSFVDTHRGSRIESQGEKT